jgi:hypothetical protein
MSDTPSKKTADEAYCSSLKTDQGKSYCLDKLKTFEITSEKLICSTLNTVIEMNVCKRDDIQDLHNKTMYNTINKYINRTVNKNYKTENKDDKVEYNSLNQADKDFYDTATAFKRTQKLNLESYASEFINKIIELNIDNTKYNLLQSFFKIEYDMFDIIGNYYTEIFNENKNRVKQIGSIVQDTNDLIKKYLDLIFDEVKLLSDKTVTTDKTVKKIEITEKYIENFKTDLINKLNTDILNIGISTNAKNVTLNTTTKQKIPELDKCDIPATCEEKKNTINNIFAIYVICSIIYLLAKLFIDVFTKDSIMYNIFLSITYISQSIIHLAFWIHLIYVITYLRQDEYCYNYQKFTNGMIVAFLVFAIIFHGLLIYNYAGKMSVRYLRIRVDYKD